MSRCPIGGCSAFIAPLNGLMCGKHWKRVPKWLRDRVYAYRNRGENDSAYRGAVNEALECARGEEVTA